jgi:hypothetical protein
MRATASASEGRALRTVRRVAPMPKAWLHERKLASEIRA